jgi:AraC-like DNA-binding protein
MSSSIYRSADDADEFRGQLRPSVTDYLLTGKGRFSATVAKVDLTNVWMQGLVESHARTWHLSISSPRIAILFSRAPSPAMSYGGAELADNDIAFVVQGMDAWHRLSGPSQLGSFSLPEELVAEETNALFGQNLTPARDTYSLRIPTRTIERVRRFHAAVADLAKAAPELITNPNVARGLDSSLTEAFVECLAAGRMKKDIARHKHWITTKRLHELAEQHPEEPLFLGDVCKALGVTRRMLHRICSEHLGMGPKQYLILRRLHMAHRALRRATPAESVTEIATRFGFWELGRFAAAYRSLFGASPSATLRRQTG